MSMFDYKYFLESLKDHSDESKRTLYQDWIKISKAERLEDEPFIEYLEEFEPLPYNYPEEWKDDFDWELLIRLIAASFSSNYNLTMPDEDSPDDKKCELAITVSSGDQTVTKKISELWSFQILRLYEIYLEEQIKLYTIQHEDESEKDCIETDRRDRIKLYNFNKMKIKNSLLRNSLLM